VRNQLPRRLSPAPGFSPGAGDVISLGAFLVVFSAPPLLLGPPVAAWKGSVLLQG
jgi:hypothetical protein